MIIRYHDQTIMYNSAKDMPAPLENMPTTHSILQLDSETTAEYNEETNP